MEVKKPNRPLSLIYAQVKKNLTLAVRKEIKETQLPFYMIEGIMQGIISELKSEAYMELAADVQSFEDQVDIFLRKQEKSMQSMETEG